MNKYCKALKGDGSPDQSTMGGDGAIFNYDFNMVQDRMAKFVIQEGLPFDHFDNPRLTKLIRDTLQPRYKHVSRTTLRRKCLKMWKQAKEDLIVFFENLQTGVNLTTDVWSAPHGLLESYLCVTAHWVTPNTWQMMKRTIAFELFAYPHTGENLFQILDYVIRTFKLENKIFSISFDNASNNTNAVEKLKLKYKPFCNGEFFHSRCVAHIINLVVQDGLAIDLVNDFKTGFKNMMYDVFKKSRARATRYRKLCKDTNSPCLGVSWDIPTRWNSTHKMFQSALRQKETLKIFHHHLVSKGRTLAFPDEGWDMIDEITEFLEVFKNSTTKLSGVYYPTSCLVLHEIYLMANNFFNFEDKNETFVKMVEPMKEKFKKYFKEIPPVFTCAAALNPYINVAGVETTIDEINSYLCLWEEDPDFAKNTKNQFNNCLNSMFDAYLVKYGQNPIHESMASSSSSRGKSIRNPIINLLNISRNETAKRQRGNTPTSELGRYCTTDWMTTLVAEEYENFDILSWWKGMEPSFPILAAMARDLLSVQASTVASESAFSFSGRVLSIRRTRLTSAAVEMCICLKDHLDAVDRIQDKTSLEDQVTIEEQIHDEEVEEGRSDPISDEELAYDRSIQINNSSGEED